MAAIPDFTSLAQQQGALNQQQVASANLANRPNQTNGMGDTSSWTLGPDGTWSNTVGLGAGSQGLLNQWQGNASQNLANLGDWGSTDITKGAVAMPDSGFGATQPVIDAWKRLQEPGLSQNEDANRTRLAAMGVTMGSDASNNNERNLSLARTDAGDKAILAGTTEYGNVFNRGLASRQQTIKENTDQSNLMNALRGKKFDEATAATGQVQSIGQPKFNGFAQSQVAPAADIYGAGRDTWSAATGQQNAQAAASANRTSGNLGLLGAGITALGGASGIGSMLGSGLSSLGSWFGGGNPGNYDQVGMDNMINGVQNGNDWGSTFEWGRE